MWLTWSKLSNHDKMFWFNFVNLLFIFISYLLFKKNLQYYMNKRNNSATVQIAQLRFSIRIWESHYDREIINANRCCSIFTVAELFTFLLVQYFGYSLPAQSHRRVIILMHSTREKIRFAWFNNCNIEIIYLSINSKSWKFLIRNVAAI